MPLGIRIKMGTEEKDLDNIFLTISDYNMSVLKEERQPGEAVQLTRNTGIKYIDGTGNKKDLINHYIGYDSSGYNEDNYKYDPSRVDASNLDAILDINGNNLVNLFYQLGTMKITSNEYKTYQIHNKIKVVNFKMKFVQNVNITIEANYETNLILMKYNDYNIININNNSAIVNNSLPVIDIKEDTIIQLNSTKLKFYIGPSAYVNIGSGTTTYSFNKDTV